MSRARSISVALGITRRSSGKMIKNPMLAVSPMAVPLFMFAAFAGALSSLGSTAGFNYYSYTAFTFVFILCETTMFAGIFTGAEMAADFDRDAGFGDRLLLAAPKRLAILGGYLLFTLGRGLLGSAILWGVALASGMPVKGGALEIAGLEALALMIGVATTGWGAGLALRIRSVTASALIFMPSFLVLFITPDFVPRNLLHGWLKAAAGINPVTPEFEAGRAFLAHKHADVGLAFGVSGALMVLLLVWAVRGMKAAERGPQAPRQRGPAGRRAGRA